MSPAQRKAALPKAASPAPPGPDDTAAGNTGVGAAGSTDIGCPSVGGAPGAGLGASGTASDGCGIGGGAAPPGPARDVSHVVSSIGFVGLLSGAKPSDFTAAAKFLYTKSLWALFFTMPTACFLSKANANNAWPLPGWNNTAVSISRDEPVKATI